MNFGKGYPVVNPYFPGLGGGLDIFNGLNPNTEPASPYTKQVCEMNIFLSCSLIITYVGFYELPNGGSGELGGKGH